MQDKIMLVYRGSLHSTWRDRCFYLGEGYNPNKAYNHRSVLQNEVIIEYDNEDIKENKRLTAIVCTRLDKDKLKYSLWTSGNKSIHLHLFINLKEAQNIPMLKKSFIRYYTKDLPLPDLQVCAPNHLIRAEYGLHEKTEKHKEPMYRVGGIVETNDIPDKVWEVYTDQRREALTRKVVYNSTELTALKGFKYIMSAVDFRKANDGHERALFMLINVLKPQYKDRREELIKLLQDWYRYSSGCKLTDKQVEFKIISSWDKTYTITEKYLNELLETIGKGDLIEKKTN